MKHYVSTFIKWCETVGPVECSLKLPVIGIVVLSYRVPIPRIALEGNDKRFRTYILLIKIIT